MGREEGGQGEDAAFAGLIVWCLDLSLRVLTSILYYCIGAIIM